MAALARSALKILTGCCTAPPQPCGRPETTRRRSSLCVSQLRPLVRSASAVLLCCREDRRDDGSALSSWCTPPTWRGRRTRRARWYDGRRWLGGGTLGNGAASVYYWTALQMALHAISSKRKESRRGSLPRPNPRPWGATCDMLSVKDTPPAIAQAAGRWLGTCLGELEPVQELARVPLVVLQPSHSLDLRLDA